MIKPKMPEKILSIALKAKTFFITVWQFLQSLAEGPEQKTLEKQFLPAVLEITETPPSPLGRTMIYVIITVFTTALLWATFSKVDIVAIAPGKLVPSGYSKIIQPLKIGIIANIFVEDGQKVVKDEPLIEIRAEETGANKIRLGQELKFAKLDVARLSALLEPIPEKAFNPDDVESELLSQHKTLLIGELEKYRASLSVIEKQIVQSEAEKAVSEAEIRKIERMLPNLKERVDAKYKLKEQGIVAPMTYLELEQDLIDLEEQLNIQKKSVAEIKAQLETQKMQYTETKNSFKNDVLYRINEARNNVSMLKEELSNAEWLEEMTTIKAPEAGIIQELSVHTVGGVVTEAQPLMKLVPKDSVLEVEAMVLNKDIGFVREEQQAVIKIDSFPFTKYGTIDATVIDISPDAIENEELGYVYKAKLSLAKDHLMVEGKKVMLSPGMTIVAEIKTGQRRLIEFLLSPMIKYTAESMRER
ncbi:MAG: HlyD family type I secretion periplasmic adaptor subunit [Alphaproteobacteria bacterium]